VEKAAGVGLPERQVQVGAQEKECTAGGFLASRQDREGEALQG
jgi:hypothetical protein